MVIYYKDKPIPIMMVRDRPTTHPVAQVLAKTKKGKRKIWQFHEVLEAKRMALRIVYDTLGVEESASFKIAVFLVQKPRSVRYGLEIVSGRQRCAICKCDMAYLKFGFPVCKYHYRKGEDDPPCPICNPAPIVKHKPCRHCVVGIVREEGALYGTVCTVCQGTGIFIRIKKGKRT